MQLTLPGFRICRACKQPIPFVHLKVDKHQQDGVTTICKRCDAQRTKARKALDPQKAKDSNNRWRSTHSDYIREKNKQYEIAHPDKTKRSKRKYAGKHRKESVEYSTRWRKNHLDKSRTICNNYRAKKLNAIGKYTADDVECKRIAQNNLCYWCSETLVVIQADHYFPLTRGGTNWPENIVVSCPSCNSSKNNRLPFDEWIPQNPLCSIPIPKTERTCQQHRDR